MGFSPALCQRVEAWSQIAYGEFVASPSARIAFKNGPFEGCAASAGDICSYCYERTLASPLWGSAKGEVSFGARNANFTNNTTIDNEEYGLAAFASTGTRMIANVARGADEAEIYVGVSPNANAKVVGNNTYRIFLSIFVRNALGGTKAGNQVHNNCLGVLVLADAPGPAGNFGVQGNEVRDNTRSCPAAEEAPPLSGVGVSLFGGGEWRLRATTSRATYPPVPPSFRAGWS
jgi:hypothetical protein